MKIVGITGSSGAGKTTLSKILNEREDVLVIDADKVVKQMSKPGTEYLTAIRECFGDEIFFEDGQLNRKALVDIIYNDDKSRENLNALTFKYVVEEILQRIKNINDSKIQTVVVDAPLLLESGLDKYCDYIVALVADKELKIKRICKRDNIDRKTAESRLNIQQDDLYYTQKADFVIINKENCDLKSEIDKIFRKE